MNESASETCPNIQAFWMSGNTAAEPIFVASEFAEFLDTFILLHEVNFLATSSVLGLRGEVENGSKFSEPDTLGNPSSNSGRLQRLKAAHSALLEGSVFLRRHS